MSKNKLIPLIVFCISVVPLHASLLQSFNRNRADITAGLSVFKYEISRIILENSNKNRPTIKQGHSILKANTIIYDDKKKKGYAFGSLYFKDSKKGTILTAGEGTYDTKSETIIVKKSPRIYFPKNKVTARSRVMTIYNKKNIIIMTGNVRIKGKKYLLRGRRAVMNQNTGEFVISGKASTKQKKTILKADKIRIDSKNNELNNYIATGHVQVTDPKQGYTIHGGRLEYFDATGYSRITQHPMIVFNNKNIKAYSTVMERYDKENKSNLLGNVIIDQGSKQAFSKWGEYDSDKKVMVLTGNPVLKDGDSMFFANKILVDTDNETMKMIGGGGGFFNLKKRQK